jgi:hypothetical protein
MSAVILEEYQPEIEIHLHKKIRFHPDLSFGEMIFYAEIESMSKGKNLPYSSRRMSEIFGVSHQTILNWVKKLINLNLIEIGVDYKGDGCNRFIKIKKPQ